MKQRVLSSRQPVKLVGDPGTDAFVFAPKGAAKLVHRGLGKIDDGGVTISRKDAAKANTKVIKGEMTKVIKGEMHLAGHRVAGIMPDGTPILEPVSKPTSFTQKQISDTIREVRAKSKSMNSLV